MHFDSLCTQETQDLRTTKPHILPLYLTSSFAFDSIDQGIRIFEKSEQGHVYGRYGNPTSDAVAKKIALLESFNTGVEGYGIMFSSGMAAIHTLILSLLKSGDQVLTQGNLYGGTTELLTKVMGRCGIETVLTDLSDLGEVETVLKKNESIRLIYFETPANPTLSCVDIKAICAIAKKHRIPVAVDNTLCTPYLQRPFAFGADFIIHSTTKFLNGHGNSIAGILIGRDREFMQGRVWETMKLTGSNVSPMEAWLVHQGLKTLTLRMDRHCSNALELARFLSKHPNVKQVNYSGLPDHPHHQLASSQMSQHGGLLSFELKKGLDAGISAMRKIKFCVLAPTLGDIDTLILHPASMSHLNIPRDIREKNGITDGLIRVSVGIENIGDIIEDIDQAIS
jgi:methionine-gamma-lyase